MDLAGRHRRILNQDRVEGRVDVGPGLTEVAERVLGGEETQAPDLDLSLLQAMSGAELRPTGRRPPGDEAQNAATLGEECLQ